MKVVLRVLCALCLCFALLFPAAPAAAALAGLDNGISSFSIEQVYVNVPEMDLFFYVLDAQGESIEPRVVKAAEPQLQLGDRMLDASSIQRAGEPICYIIVLDNSDRVEPATLTAYKRAVEALCERKGERDQILLYTLAGGVKKELAASVDTAAVKKALHAVKRAGGGRDVLGAASSIAQDVEDDFQSLAPRKVLIVCTDLLAVLENAALAGGLLIGQTEGLGMEICTMVAVDSEEDLSLLGSIASDEILPTLPENTTKTLLAKVDQLGKALECKTVVDDDLYGSRLETLTLSVPSLGSAVRTSTTVYMGHRLLRPAVTKVTAIDRNHLKVTFNQAVSDATAGSVRAYTIRSEDAWGFQVGIRAAQPSQDGSSVVLTTRDPLYSGDYSIRLRDVAAAMSSANVSDKSSKHAFRLSGWERDRQFYWARMRLPGMILTVLLLALSIGAFVNIRRERSAEAAAEVEHLLYGGGDLNQADTPPHRWLTLFIRSPGAVAETRWSQMVENSLLIGSDPAQCELCLSDAHVAAQHCVLALDGADVMVRPLGEKGKEKRVYLNEIRIAGACRLNNDDVIRIGNTAIRIVL